MIVAGAWRPDSMITWAVGCAWRISRSVSMPSRPGIITSSRMTLGADPPRSPSSSDVPLLNTSIA